MLDLEYLANFLARVPRLQLYQETVAHAEFHGLIHLAGLDQLRAVSFTKISVHLIPGPGAGPISAGEPGMEQDVRMTSPLLRSGNHRESELF